MEKITVELVSEMAQFFGRAPSLEEIITYKFPEQFDDYFQTLMDRTVMEQFHPKSTKNKGSS